MALKFKRPIQPVMFRVVDGLQAEVYAIQWKPFDRDEEIVQLSFIISAPNHSISRRMKFVETVRSENLTQENIVAMLGKAVMMAKAKNIHHG